MVESNDHRHMSLRALALHAQRIGRVLASSSTWYRLVRTAGWRRPRNRVYPAKPKVGIRAKTPGELLHLDVTIIRLLDGTRAYLHAVIDNYSRRILSWTLEERLGSGGMRRMRRGDEFGGVAIATGAVQNVVRRSTLSCQNAECRWCGKRGLFFLLPPFIPGPDQSIRTPSKFRA
jgi:hypothetical protein